MTILGFAVGANADTSSSEFDLELTAISPSNRDQPEVAEEASHAKSAAERISFDVSTSTLHMNDKLDFWRDMARRAIVSCEVSARLPAAFDIEASGLIQNSLGLSSIRCTDFNVVRDPDRSLDAVDDSVLLFFIKTGRLIVNQNKRSTVIGPGDAVAVVADRPYAIQVEGPHEASAIRLPRILLGASSALEPVIARSLIEAGDVGKFLFDFAIRLCDKPGAMDAHIVGRLAQSFAALLSTACDVLSGADEHVLPVAGKRATLNRVKAYVDLHLTDMNLTVRTVSERLGLSERYLSKLFEIEATTLSRYIWAQRLDRAALALAKPPSRSEPVKAIALMHGFKDLSHFSTAFRRRFQQTPTQYQVNVWRALGIVPDNMKSPAA